MKMKVQKSYQSETDFCFSITKFRGGRKGAQQKLLSERRRYIR